MKFEAFGFELFDQIIDYYKNMSYRQFRLNGTRFYSHDVFEDVISDLSNGPIDDLNEDYGVKALLIIQDISKHGLYDWYRSLLEQPIRHHYADSYNTIKKKKNLYYIFNNEGTREVSKLIVTAIINHPLVQYYLTENRNDLLKIKDYIHPNDMKVIAHKLPTFYKIMQDKNYLSVMLP